MTKREILADSLLLLTALIWGLRVCGGQKRAGQLSFPGAIIAMRYLIAAAITGILFRRHLKELTRGDVARGALVGLLLFGAYIVQTTGLQYTTAGKNAFLTTVYVLLVPFGCALLFHQKLQKSNLIAAVMMLVGIGLLSLDGQGGGLNPGDILTLICGLSVCRTHHCGGTMPEEDEHLRAHRAAIRVLRPLCGPVQPDL